MYLDYHEIDAEVIIIGSGISGLTAAYKLLQKEPTFDLLILDAAGEQDAEDQNVKSESDWCKNQLHFVCSHQKKLVSFLNELGVNLKPQDWNFEGSGLVDYEDIFKINQKSELNSFCSVIARYQISRFIEKIDSICKNKLDVILNEYGELDTLNLENYILQNISVKSGQDFLKQTVLINCGVPPNKISALFFLAFCHSTKGMSNQLLNKRNGIYEFYVEGNISKVSSKLISKVDKENIVTCGTIVSIKDKRFIIEIKTSDKTFYCRNVIISKAMPNLNSIDFYPLMPSDRFNVYRNMEGGYIKKFFIRYALPFWRELHLSGDVYIFDICCDKGPVLVCLNASQNEFYVLAGLARKTKPTQGKNLKQEILRHLAVYFGEYALDSLDYFEEDGSFFEETPMFCFGLGTMQGIFSIRRPVNGRIFWAGAETSNTWYGMLAGSVQSGYRAAMESLYEIRPSLLTKSEITLFSPPNVTRIHGNYLVETLNQDEDRTYRRYRIKWHIVTPAILLIIFVLYKTRRWWGPIKKTSHQL